MTTVHSTCKQLNLYLHSVSCSPVLYTIECSKHPPSNSLYAELKGYVGLACGEVDQPACMLDMDEGASLGVQPLLREGSSAWYKVDCIEDVRENPRNAGQVNCCWIVTNVLTLHYHSPSCNLVTWCLMYTFC
jgi:hypothetical protein